MYAIPWNAPGSITFKLMFDKLIWVNQEAENDSDPFPMNVMLLSTKYKSVIFGRERISLGICFNWLASKYKIDNVFAEGEVTTEVRISSVIASFKLLLLRISDRRDNDWAGKTNSPKPVHFSILNWSKFGKLGRDCRLFMLSEWKN